MSHLPDRKAASADEGVTESRTRYAPAAAEALAPALLLASDDS
jgi:hypothetical protein